MAISSGRGNLLILISMGVIILLCATARKTYPVTPTHDCTNDAGTESCTIHLK